MKLDAKKFDFKQAVKVLGGLSLLDLIYLNIILPVSLSSQQIYLVAESVVVICHKKKYRLKQYNPQAIRRDL